MITAMNTFTDIFVILGLIALTAVLVQLVRGAVRGDGYGRRPAPRSHHDDFFTVGRPHAL